MMSEADRPAALSAYYRTDRSKYGFNFAVGVSVVLHVLALGGLFLAGQASDKDLRITNAMEVKLAGRPDAGGGRKSKAPVAGRQKKTKPPPKKKAPPKKKPKAKKAAPKANDVGLNREKKKKPKPAKPKPAPEKASNHSDARKNPPTKKPDPPPDKQKGPIAQGGFGGDEKSGLSFDVGNTEEVDLSDVEWQAYYRNVYSQVSRRWSRGSVIAGVARVRFFVEKSGAVKNVSVVRTSGRSFLDNKAKRAVKGVSGLPPLPQGFRGNRLIINIDFDYGSQK